jgi:hypothetical protein
MSNPFLLRPLAQRRRTGEPEGARLMLAILRALRGADQSGFPGHEPGTNPDVRRRSALLRQSCSLASRRRAQVGRGCAEAPAEGAVVYPVVSGPKRIWWSGGWKTFVPYAALGAVTVGGAAYYANSYVSAARPYCSGITPQGCQLRWQMVSFEGGGGDYQCVQFCPQGGPPAGAMMPQPAGVMMPPSQPGGPRPLGAGPGMAPVQQAAVTPPPAGQCALTIFAEPGFAGLSAPSEEDQPHLGEVGWKNQVASIQVKSGTWDFFTEDEFQGESMRLQPGQYPQLAPEWSKRVGSFMCVQ